MLEAEDEDDTRFMRDETHLRRRRITVRDEPEWASETPTDPDPLKPPDHKSYCTCCGRYCVMDFFHVEFNIDCANNNCLKAGGGHLVEDDDIYEKYRKIMRCCRNGAYLIMEDHLKSLVPKYMHGWLNECIVNKIMNRFPAPDGDYDGFQYTIEHMNETLQAQAEAAAEMKEERVGESEEGNGKKRVTFKDDDDASSEYLSESSESSSEDEEDDQYYDLSLAALNSTDYK